MKCTVCGSQYLKIVITHGMPYTRIACETCGNKETIDHNPKECVENGHNWELMGNYLICRRCAVIVNVHVTPEAAYFKQFSGE